MNKTRLLLLIFLIIPLSFLAKGCSFLPKTSLMILSYHLEKIVVDGELTAEIEGAAVNDGSAELQYAEVIGEFYHKDGTLLYSGVASTTDLISPGEIWEFTISRDVHPSLNILSWDLKKDSSGARIEGQAENNGDVILSFAEITGTFHKSNGDELHSGTTTTTMLGVGEVWQFVIPYAGPYAEAIGYAKTEVTDIDYEPEPAQDVVDYATVEVGTLRGRTIMP